MYSKTCYMYLSIELIPASSTSLPNVIQGGSPHKLLKPASLVVAATVGPGVSPTSNNSNNTSLSIETMQRSVANAFTLKYS